MQPGRKTVWGLLKTVNVEPPHDLASPPPALEPEKSIMENDPGSSVFKAALLTIFNRQHHPKCPSIETWRVTGPSTHRLSIETWRVTSPSTHRLRKPTCDN